jgi:hypothetical protein
MIFRKAMGSKKGTSLIDFLLSMAIVVMLFGGVYAVYFSIVNAVQNIGTRNAAAAVMANEIETIRNLPYASVGTVGGIPSGVLPQSQTVAYGHYTFTLQTDIRSIDDPFDGTLGGTPNDTSPADYKLASVQATCTSCTGTFLPVTVTATVAPKNLETNAGEGSLFIYVLDAIPSAVSGASVHVTNASVTPAIDLTDTTNASGVLELVGAPTSTQGYQVTVTKAGYSKSQTYPPGAPGNPNPDDPNLTVVNQTVSKKTLRIDRVSQMTVLTADNRCRAIPLEPFKIQGSKTIGPGILKFSTSSATNASGSTTFSNLEWDDYLLAFQDASRNVAGTIPLDPFTVNPNTATTFRFILAPGSNPSLLVTVTNAATGAGIPDASVTITKGGFSASSTTDHATLAQSDWSGGAYSSESGVDAVSQPGALTLLINASGTYDVGTASWLISNTFDVGGSNSVFHAIAWNPAVQPPAAGPGSVVFQIAANNDGATWNFIGPGGTGGTFFTDPGATLPASLSGNRYVRYKVFLNTADPTVSPTVNDVSIDFSADCIPPAQAFFGGLAQGIYAIDITAPGYGQVSSSVSVGAGEASSSVSLTAN